MNRFGMLNYLVTEMGWGEETVVVLTCASQGVGGNAEVSFGVGGGWLVVMVLTVVVQSLSLAVFPYPNTSFSILQLISTLTPLILISIFLYHTYRHPILHFSCFCCYSRYLFPFSLFSYITTFLPLQFYILWFLVTFCFVSQCFFLLLSFYFHILSIVIQLPVFSFHSLTFFLLLFSLFPFPLPQKCVAKDLIKSR